MNWVPRICIYCGAEFQAPPWAIKRGRGKVCSISCPGRAKKAPAPRSRSLVRLDALRPGDRFYINNRKGVVVERHLLYDAVRIKLGRRVHLWHRAICVEPIPAGYAPEIDRNGTLRPKQATRHHRDTLGGFGAGETG